MKRVRKDIVATIDVYGEIEEVGERAKLTIEERERKDVVPVKEGKFTKVWDVDIELGWIETVFLVRIRKWVWYEDNTIREKGEPMTVKEMAGVTGVGYARLSEGIKGMIKRGIMGVHDAGIIEGYRGRRKRVYSVNPMIMCRGAVVRKEIVDYYRECAYTKGNFGIKTAET